MAMVLGKLGAVFGRLGLLGNSQGGGGGGGESALLLETGDYLILEDGTSRLLLENP